MISYFSLPDQTSSRRHTPGSWRSWSRWEGCGPQQVGPRAGRAPALCTVCPGTTKQTDFEIGVQFILAQQQTNRLWYRSTVCPGTTNFEIGVLFFLAQTNKLLDWCTVCPGTQKHANFEMGVHSVCPGWHKNKLWEWCRFFLAQTNKFWDLCTFFWPKQTLRYSEVTLIPGKPNTVFSVQFVLATTLRGSWCTVCLGNNSWGSMFESRHIPTLKQGCNWARA